MNVYKQMMELERQHTNEEVKSMKKLCTRRIYFWGSGEHHERLLFEKDDGTLWCRWYGQLIQIERRTYGWWTVESY